MKHRPIVILAVSFAVVLAAGVALAQVGSYAPGFTELADKSDSVVSDVLSLPQTQDPEALDLTEATPSKVDLKEVRPVKEEPKKVVDQPEKPAEEPKDEPADTTPPKLTITSPTDGAHFGEKTLKYTGMTEPGTRVFAGEWEADVFESGEWHIVLVLSAGKNVTTFTAKDPAGNRTKAAVTAYLDASGKEFTAHQKYGTNSEPWEKFSGTAMPGTVIELGSEYGDARLVTEGYEWFLKLHFEGLTEATTFTIVLHTSTGQEMNFTFTYDPKPIEFSATQKYESCSGPEPYNKYYGTATPGTTITVTSDHGSASTVAAANGEWLIPVFFTGTTDGEPFVVTVNDSEGHEKTFSFVTYESGSK